MAQIVTVYAAKTHLSRLIERALAGEEVVIARGKTPVVRLVPVDAVKPRRKFGAMRGKARTTRAFFEPLPREEIGPAVRVERRPLVGLVEILGSSSDLGPAQEAIQREIDASLDRTARLISGESPSGGRTRRHSRR